jgi:hypothetical protein|tara:strand:+ start:207 stop:386 length:180 start_codon:yes stop_codon:yes gene_type:complete
MKDEDWVDAVERKLRPPREYVSADEYSKRVQKMLSMETKSREIVASALDLAVKKALEIK